MKNKLLIVTCHLSTGGSPQYLLDFLRSFKDNYDEVKVIEFTNFSSSFVIQKNKIKSLIGEENLICLGEYGIPVEMWNNDKMKLISIIDEYSPDVVWMNEFPECYEYQLPPKKVMDHIYRENRPYKIIETTHFNSFNFDNKTYIGDEFMFCSPSHMEKSKNIDIKKYVWETPIDIKERPDRTTTLESLGLDPSYFHVLHVGLFNTNKNQRYIFDIAHMMRNDKVMFHFIGNQCFFDECNISNDDISMTNTKIWGERDDVETFMSCMDLYLFPSKKELNPITIREALSYQMEVIANRDEYVSQYKNYENFHILDEVDVVSHIRKKLKKFLLVCSVYNKTEDQIRKTIQSVLNQTYTNWELIIGDDESDMDCSYIIKEIIEEIGDDRISFYNVKYKYELYLYQNFFKEKEYDYFFDLDSDDILDKNILDVYQKHFIKYPNVHSIFCDYKVVGEDGKLQRYGLVHSSRDLIEEFNFRTYQDKSYLGIWEKKPSWSMFGVGRCFRRSKFDKFEIGKRCRTATDSMVLFNTMLEGDHLHIPMDLYTYERKEGSDSGTLTQEEMSNYNVNTLVARRKYYNYTSTGKGYGSVNIYDGIYLETSAVIMSNIKDEEISIITKLSEGKKKKIEFLFNGRVKVNDLSCKNIIVIKNKIQNNPTFDGKNVFYYEFFGDFDVPEEKLEEYFKESRESSLKDMEFDNYFHYFRHFIFRKDKTGIKNNILINEFDGVKLEIQGNVKEEYDVEFIDGDTDKVIFRNIISNNMWTMPNAKYYVNWLIKVNGETVYKQDLRGKRVYFEFGSSSLGDTLAWFPYIMEFKKKHQCHVTVLTYKNWLFEGHEMYKDIEFIKPGEEFNNINKRYQIGWFVNEDGSVDINRSPQDFKSLPLQQTASDVIGLEHTQIRPTINMSYTDTPPIDNKYVCIAIHSTAQAKYWNNPDGWQKTTDYLKELGYEVILISSEENGYMGNYHPKGITHINGSIEEVANYLYHSEFFIGISSGLSWLAWAVGTPIILISGFSEPYTEFSGDDIIRVINKEVCHGCFNSHKLDPSDWHWCPLHKGTDRQFECTKKIYAETIYGHIDNMIKYKNTLNEIQYSS